MLLPHAVRWNYTSTWPLCNFWNIDAIQLGLSNCCMTLDQVKTLFGESELESLVLYWYYIWSWKITSKENKKYAKVNFFSLGISQRGGSSLCKGILGVRFYKSEILKTHLLILILEWNCTNFTKCILIQLKVQGALKSQNFGGKSFDH